MSKEYKIAVASSDGTSIDLSFGAADAFLIYQVYADNKYGLLEKRCWDSEAADAEQAGCSSSSCSAGTKESECSKASDGGCGSGSGCSGKGADIPKLGLIDDCRAILCRKLGFQVRKQLEKKAIAAFDIEYGIDEAMEKIVMYFDRVDNHKTLRGISNPGGSDIR